MSTRSDIKRFIAELRRRRVIKATVAYLVVAWLIIETTSVLFPAVLLPEWTHRLVVILAGAGIPIVLVLAWVFDISPDGIKVTDESTDSSADADGQAVERSAAPALLPPQADSAIASICLLPFEVRSSDPEDTFIAQGISAEISSALTNLSGVRVISRILTSAAGEGTDLRELGARFGAQYVLTGSLGRGGDKIRIIVELTDASTGSQLWSESYHRVLDDLLDVEEEIAGAIVGSFGGEQLREQIKKATTGETKNTTAWSLVHKARSFILNYTEENLREAVSLARQAIELDPDYAAAHAALADALTERITNGLSEDPKAELDEAVRAIDTATAKAADDSFVLKLAGNVLMLAGQHDKAVDCLKRAVEVSPFDLGAWGYLGRALATTDDDSQLTEAENILDRILEMAPQHPGAGYWWHHKALVSTCRGDFANAISFVKTSLQQQPGLAWAWYLKANAQASNGDMQGAQEALARAEAANDDLSYKEFAAVVERTSATKGAAERRLDGLALLGLT